LLESSVESGDDLSEGDGVGEWGKKLMCNQKENHGKVRIEKRIESYGRANACIFSSRNSGFC
ncbi:hypothetical protein, partial [Persicitalea sp.]|uniref:hypothetical protein n=1 Tax=Persicitalea sp. TaxID=3100273 RepID=UPI003593E567